MAKKRTNKTAPAKGAKKNTKNRLLRFTLKAATVTTLLAILFFILVFLGILGPVPSKRKLQKINNPVASEVYSADGILLGRYYLENRSNVTFEEISPNVINALVATEDSRFYEHRGIDEIALMRVLVKTILLQDKSSGGGSTLSQQIAKNLFPRVDYGPLSIPVNKLREAIIAYRLERIYTKQQILALYLNTVPFGENIYGIEVASERFFSKPPSKLEVHEAAVLVGMLKANTYYNPRINPEKSKNRRNVVIDQMVSNNYITSEQAEKYKNKPLKINYRLITYNQGPAPYFLEMLRPELLEWCETHKKPNGKPYNLYTDGLRITTTIDYNLQHYAQLSVKEYMKNLQNVFDNHWKNRDLFAQNPDIIESAMDRYIQDKFPEKEAGAEEIKEHFNQEIKTTLFTWNGLKDTTVTRLDSLKHYQKLLNAGFIAIDPHQGNLKAFVGGIDFRFFKYNHVTAPRQTGSTFKPLVYLAALEEGVDADTYFANDLKVYRKYDDWSPRNSHDEYGGYYTMKGALAQSLNTVSVDILLEAGIRNTIDLARELGITADLPRYPSLALGVASVSLKEMVEAYAGIVNDGIPVKANYLVTIANDNGEILEQVSPFVAETSVVSPDNARAVVQMLEAVIDHGTGKAIRNVYGIHSDFAGKTGTTQNHSDGWFIGMTPNLVAGCWVGADDPRVHFRSITYGQGSYMALPIVGKFFHKTYRDPKFSELKNSRFNLPGPEMLAMLELPEYRDVLELEKDWFNLANIFGKKDKTDTELKETPQSTGQDQDQGEKKTLWGKIKKIFKKN